jgi:hypothetical protein
LSLLKRTGQVVGKRAKLWERDSGYLVVEVVSNPIEEAEK